MYTYCPHCRTTFRIHPDQLAQARGQVRCGVCYGFFNALDGLSEHPTPPPPSVPAAAQDTAPAEPVADQAEQPVAERAEQPVAEATAAEEAAGALEMAEGTGELAAEETAPPNEQPAPQAPRREDALPDLGIIAAEPRHAPEIKETTAAPPWKTAVWGAANVLLILLLAGQYLYYNRQPLAQYPELRPWLTQMCAGLGCDVPLQRDVQRIALTSRLVESHPTRPNALLIDATLINQADFTQPYPLLELRFSDLNNQLLAGRRFRPSEYLPHGTILQAGMAPHQPVHITLEIADPGKDAVSFQFDLL